MAWNKGSILAQLAAAAVATVLGVASYYFVPYSHDDGVQYGLRIMAPGTHSSRGGGIAYDMIWDEQVLIVITLTLVLVSMRPDMPRSHSLVAGAAVVACIICFTAGLI